MRSRRKFGRDNLLYPTLFELCSNAEPQRSLQGETDEEVAMELEILLEMY